MEQWLLFTLRNTPRVKDGDSKEMGKEVENYVNPKMFPFWNLIKCIYVDK